MTSPEVLWRPSEDRIERAWLTRYQRWLQSNRGLQFDDYQELWRWSVDDLDAFWSSLVEFLDVRFEEPPAAVLGSRSMPGAEWFPGSRLSYAEHVFRGKRDEDVAIRHASELRRLGEWTWERLRAETASLAVGLRSVGVGPPVPDGCIDHLWIRVRDLATSRRFYRTIAPHAGLRLGVDKPARVQMRGEDFSFSLIDDGRPLTEHVHLAFPAQDDSTVRAFHAAALAAGYEDHGGPGERAVYHPGYYAAFVLDPDGHNVEVVNHNR